jgi:hypothetical protein
MRRIDIAAYLLACVTLSITNTKDLQLKCWYT